MKSMSAGVHVRYQTGGRGKGVRSAWGLIEIFYLEDPVVDSSDLQVPPV